jgi:murein DD-endopeptidase MepM/ murein hydrolase activator NlpD
MSQRMTRIASAVRQTISQFLRSAIFRRRALISAGVLGVFGATVAIGTVPTEPDVAALPTRQIVESLALPDFTQQVAYHDDAAPEFIREDRVQRGDSIATILNRMGVDDNELQQFLRSAPSARSIYQLYAGRVVQASTDSEGKVRWLRYIHTPGTEDKGRVVTQLLHVERTPEGLVARDMAIDTERHEQASTAEIRSSLFGATDAAGIPDSVATQMAEILSSEIDFHKDLRRGDRFRVVYETFTHEGTYVRSGKVLALEFVNAGKPYEAVWYDGEPGQPGGYYDLSGKSMRKGFLRNPLEFTRVTSGFSMRFHPILKTWRAHKGVDFGAPTGTPIRTTADGVVDFIGVQNGYGNIVVVRHFGEYTTAYGHMSRFGEGLKKGDKVSQGQLIGYVGSTGYATGPHLHYEFRIAGEQVDPMKVALPEAPTLDARGLAAFHKGTANFEHQLSLMRQFDQTGISVATAAR